MELRHLRYFVAVAEELNFRRAAERLHLSQPSLSRQVLDLEEEIGERLFERDRRRVALTHAGRALLKEARGVLAGTEIAIQAAREAGRAMRGALHIGSIGTLSASFLPGSLAKFRERFATMDVEVLELGLDEQTAALLAGTIEIGFQARTPGTPADPRFAERAVLTSPLMVAMSARHHLAKAPTLPLHTLADEKLLHLGPRPGAGYDRWVRALCEETGGFTPKFRHPEIGNIEALFGMIAAGQGVAILPEIVAARSVEESAGWIIKKLGPPGLELQVAAVWNPANPSVVLSNYLKILTGHVSAMKGKTISQAEKRTR